MSKAKLMLGSTVEISLIFRRILGPLDLGWSPNHFVLGAQLAPGVKKVSLFPCSVPISIRQEAKLPCTLLAEPSTF